MPLYPTAVKWVHPRVCGELLFVGHIQSARTGSSPRVWGTPGNKEQGSSQFRFIPACVGNSATWSQIATYRAVHPRVCGELSPQASKPSCTVGSSPRVWGTRRGYRGRRLGHRFIPACVGNSCPLGRNRLQSSVHPRVCGELPCTGINSLWCFGSSPRVWGTQTESPGTRGISRFIPACVGNSRPACASLADCTVHPRVCGELLSAVDSGSHFYGSSPRVWGTPLLPCIRQDGLRFIPACVGNSERMM